MKNKTFEDFLMEKHAENYQGFDDNMSDDFTDWLVELRIDDVIKYANEYAATQKQELLKKHSYECCQVLKKQKQSFKKAIEGMKKGYSLRNKRLIK